MNPNERRADGQHAPRLECGCFRRRGRPRVLMPDDPRPRAPRRPGPASGAPTAARTTWTTRPSPLRAAAGPAATAFRTPPPFGAIFIFSYLFNGTMRYPSDGRHPPPPARRLPAVRPHMPGVPDGRRRPPAVLLKVRHGRHFLANRYLYVGTKSTGPHEHELQLPRMRRVRVRRVRVLRSRGWTGRVLTEKIFLRPFLFHFSMAVLSGGDVSAADRRRVVQELSGISPSLFTDDELDQKIENWDAASLAYFGGPADPAATSYFRLILNVANLLAAAAVRQGIGGDTNVRTADAHIALAKSLVGAHNRREPEQSAQTMTTAGGIGRYSSEGDEIRGAFG